MTPEPTSTSESTNQEPSSSISDHEQEKTVEQTTPGQQEETQQLNEEQLREEIRKEVDYKVKEKKDQDKPKELPVEAFGPRQSSLEKLRKAKGMGDVVEVFTEATGIKKAVKIFMDGKDCGCDKRKETLNKLFPLRKRVKMNGCLTEDEFDFLNEVIPGIVRARKVPEKYQPQLWDIHNRMTNTYGPEVKSCGQCWSRVIRDLRNIMNLYKEGK